MSQEEKFKPAKTALNQFRQIALKTDALILIGQLRAMNRGDNAKNSNSKNETAKGNTSEV